MTIRTIRTYSKRGPRRAGFILIIFICLSASGIAQEYGGPDTTRDSLQIIWPGGAKMALSITFDDARPSQVDIGLPLLNKYAIKGTFYVSPDLMEMRPDKWKAAAASGHEIGNHSLLHPCSGNYMWARENPVEGYTMEKMRMELDAANQLIFDLLGVRPVSYAYPCGHTTVGKGKQTQSYVPLIASMFESGRVVGDTPLDPLYCDLAHLSSVGMDNTSFKELMLYIDRAKADGLWLIVHGHEVGTDDPLNTTVSTLDSLCRFAADPENEVWVDHVSAVASHIRDYTESPALAHYPYRDPLLPVEQRIEDLLSRMTLEEKIGQLNMPFVLDWVLESSEEEAKGTIMEFVGGRSREGIGPVGGLFALPNTLLFGGPEEQARYLNTLQREAMTHTRLGIPLIQTEEGTHGLRCSGGTIFPEGPALGSTWNLDLIGQVYEAAAREARAIGVHQLFTLVVEPIRDPRMGRNQEAYSEDPFQTAKIAEAIVRAVQGHSVASKDRVIAGLGHFPGQSSPVSGLERGAMNISERTLREIFLPPWEAGIKNAGALGVMATYPSIDGVPAHASSWLLEDILRGELGFEGLVLSEGGGIETLIYTGLSENLSEAAAMSANAGLDVCITPGNGYEGEMIANVLEGTVSEETINRSVKRVLDMKFRLGLFEDPFVDPRLAVTLSHTMKNQALALQAGREGIVLLKNEDRILPLGKDIGSIAVIGPNADDERNQLGDYTSSVIIQDITTCLDGIRNKLGGDAEIRYVKGCEVIGEELNEIDEAVHAAENAEVAIVVVGENEWMKSHGGGTVGEGYDVATLELTGLQEKLVRKVFATGTPTIVILINGRPLAIPWIKEHVPAIIEAWNPGEKGGEAIADILFGDYNPSGKLTLTIPRHAGQLPVYYNHKPSKTYWLENGWGNSYADLENAPLYEFGFGLSYTNFDYENLVISPSSGKPFGDYSVSLEVRNSGDIAGAEVVQLYIRDKKSTVVRPVKELKGFAKIDLDPGESGNVKFELGFNELKSLDRNLNWVVEPGTFNIMVGSSSDDIRLEGEIEVR